MRKIVQLIIMFIFIIGIMNYYTCQKDKSSITNSNIHDQDYSFIVDTLSQVIEINDPNSSLYGVIIEIPENTFSESIEIVIKNVINPVPLNDPNLVFVGPVINISPTKTVNLNKAIQITFPIINQNLSNILVGAYYDENSEIWELIPQTNLDVSGKKITISINHLSIFGPLGWGLPNELIQLLLQNKK